MQKSTHTLNVKLDEFLHMYIFGSYSADPENISRIPDGLRVAFIFGSQHFEYQVPWLVCGITRIGIITVVPGD